jgi:hypothetical protein
MKLQVTFNMPLPEGYEPFLEVIAKTHGWSEATGVTVTEYIRSQVCQPQVSALFEGLIKGALYPFFGSAGAAQVEQIVDHYRAYHQVSADIIPDLPG